MKNQKLIAIVFLMFFFISCNTSADEYDIWGLWNVGPKDTADIKFRGFLRTWEFLFFSNENNENPIIIYEGGYHKIIKVIAKKGNEMYFFIEQLQPVLDTEGAIVMGTVFGKVVMHFIDKDRMWLMLDYTDDDYPTDKQFSSMDFKGETVIFWRAQRQ